LRNDAEYDFGHEDNSMDWLAHQCAEFETALKLRVIPELKGMLDASLAWAGSEEMDSPTVGHFNAGFCCRIIACMEVDIMK